MYVCMYIQVLITSIYIYIYIYIYYGSCIGRCAPQLKLMRKPPKVYFLLLFRALASADFQRPDEDPDDSVTKIAYLLFLAHPNTKENRSYSAQYQVGAFASVSTGLELGAHRRSFGVPGEAIIGHRAKGRRSIGTETEKSGGPLMHSNTTSHDKSRPFTTRNEQ